MKMGEVGNCMVVELLGISNMLWVSMLSVKLWDGNEAKPVELRVEQSPLWSPSESLRSVKTGTGRERRKGRLGG